MSKLTSYDKATIREWYDTYEYTQGELAEIYGVSRATIQRVLYEPDFPTETVYGHPVPTENEDEHEMSTEMLMDDAPPKWLGIGMLMLAWGMAVFIGWVIYHATT